ncbi:MAG: hypothetical protein ACHQ4H_14450 [Ktedonobacterales bacterium]
MSNSQQQDMNGSNDQQAQQAQQAANNDGLPGGGVGRREGPFNTPVYPVSADQGATGDAPVEGEMAWGQGKEGAAGYQDSGGSGLDDADEQLAQQQQGATQQGTEQQGGAPGQS